MEPGSALHLLDLVCTLLETYLALQSSTQYRPSG